MTDEPKPGPQRVTHAYSPPRSPFEAFTDELEPVDKQPDAPSRLEAWLAEDPGSRTVDVKSSLDDGWQVCLFLWKGNTIVRLIRVTEHHPDETENGLVGLAATINAALDKAGEAGS